MLCQGAASMVYRATIGMAGVQQLAGVAGWHAWLATADDCEVVHVIPDVLRSLRDVNQVLF
jgi:hypothetical protein